jgi:hypothetical protein
MMLTAPLGLLALLAIPAIVAIHLFRRRFPTRPVAGLFLWQVVRNVLEGSGRITKLPITASLILECLAALALALIISGARWHPSGVSPHLVVLLDDSASMSATNPQGESSRDRAVRRILAEVRRLGSTGRVTLIQSGERPSVLLGPAALAAEVQAALDKWKPQAVHHSLALSLRLARELAGTSGRIMVVSDVTPAIRGAGEIEGAIWTAVGQELENVGITGAQRTLSAEQGMAIVSLTLGNFSPSAARRHLRIVTPGGQGTEEKEIFAKDLDIPSGTSSLNVPLPPGLPPMRVLLSDDALRRDNEVVLVEPHPQVVAVQNRLHDGRGKQALNKALDALGGVTRAEPGHIVFEDAAEIGSPVQSGSWPVAFGRPPANVLDAGDPKDFAGPFIPEKRHPLLQGVSLAGVVWAGTFPLAAGKFHPLVSAGTQPLIGLLGRQPEDGILFNLDLERTNLVRAPDWPILLSNLIEMRRQSLPGPERWNYRIGEWVRIRLDHDPKGPLHFRCGNIERSLPSGHTLEFIAPAPGGLLQVMEGNQTLFELGVNFLDQDETDLRNKSTAETGTYSAEARGLRIESGPAFDPLFWTLLFVAAAALLANWCLPRRAGASS